MSYEDQNCFGTYEANNEECIKCYEKNKCMSEFDLRNKTSKRVEVRDENGKFIDCGLIRKKREFLSFFATIICAVFLVSLSYMTNSIILLFLLIMLHMYCVYEGIRTLSSHDINTWKHSTHVTGLIYISCFFGAFGGIPMYYHLKRKERKYLCSLSQLV